jgi:hypothetical protein
MTWFSPATMVVDDVRGGFSPGSWAMRPGSRGLGSAIAGVGYWDTARADAGRARPTAAVTFYQPEGVRLRAPRDVLARMAGAAGALGRSESDIWVEAAREWLVRHAPDAPAGGHPALSGAVAPRRIGALSGTGASSQSARRSRAWRDIDGVLACLRDQPPHRHGAPDAA